MENVYGETASAALDDAKLVGEAPDTLTVLHLGDVLLDGPVRRLRRDTKEHRREDLRESFNAFMRCVESEGADVVLFSGNLLDGRYAENDTLTFLIRAFEAHPRCHFVIAPGPMDPYDENSVYRSKRLPRNVHVFAEEVSDAYNFPELPLTVYGWGYRESTCKNEPLAGTHRKKNDRFTVLCGYTCLDENDSMAPIDRETLSAFGAHYAAFSGKPHGGFDRVGDGICAYSGSFEGREAQDGESKMGGYIRIRATRCEGGWSVEAARVPLDTYSYATERLDVSHLKTVEEAAARLRACIATKGHGEKTVLRVVLCGSVSLSASFAGLEAEDYGVYSLWIEDRTVPTDDGGALLQQMNAGGELYRHFYPLMTDGTEEEKARAARAFRAAYAALRGEDFERF